MKILHVVNNLDITCGASRQILSNLNILQKNEHTVFILVPKETVDRRLNDLKIPFMEIDYRYEDRSPFRILFHLIRVFNFIRKNRFEVVHCHHFYQAFLFSFFRKIFHYQLIQTIRQDFDDTLGKIPHYSADKIIFLSEIIRKEKIPYIKNKKTFVVQNPLIFISSSKTIVKSENEEFTLAFIGRFSKDKNIDLILNALKIISHEKLRIIFIGRGVEENKIREFAETTIHNVEILKERYDIEEIYLQADIILLPSLIEGVPNVIMEAGFFSKAVITSNVGGILELVKDNESGIILKDIFDPAELKQKILLLKNDNILRKRLGEKLKDKISCLPTPEMNYSSILDIYKL